MALKKEQAINLVNQNEDTEVRKICPWLDIKEFVELFYMYKSEKPDFKKTGYKRMLQEIDARIESCDLPDLIAPLVYEALLEREDVEYLRTL